MKRGLRQEAVFIDHRRSTSLITGHHSYRRWMCGISRNRPKRDGYGWQREMPDGTNSECGTGGSALRLIASAGSQWT
ncbi:hypothetical protein WL90_33075 [Burkholderia cenocepacia]|nr:hypothetical protein WL90_33075 [Burkholderia cenocepacia]